MTPDDELEKLADLWGDEIAQGKTQVINFNMDAEYAFKAGFRAAEKMMAEKFPTARELFYAFMENESLPNENWSNIPQWQQDEYQFFITWLKQKLLG